MSPNKKYLYHLSIFLVSYYNQPKWVGFSKIKSKSFNRKTDQQIEASFVDFNFDKNHDDDEKTGCQQEDH